MDQEGFAFGDIRVDFRRMSAWRGEEIVALEPKTFDVLRYLIDHRDRLVTKEELLDAVWKETFVTPTSSPGRWPSFGKRWVTMRSRPDISKRFPAAATGSLHR